MTVRRALKYFLSRVVIDLGVNGALGTDEVELLAAALVVGAVLLGNVGSPAAALVVGLLG